MPKPTKTELIRAALLARGYSQLQPKEPLATSGWKFKISFTHARRLDTPASVVSLGDSAAVRLGRVPMPRAMLDSLVLEGEAVLAAKASRPITLADIGL